jgi:DNA repair exonuclease SbcCD ATPase subunit
LNLEEIGPRRIGVYILEDYYGTAMAEIGREYLGIDGRIREMNLKSQWGKIRVRIQSLDQHSIPEDYQSIAPSLKDIRDSVAHDYDYEPPESQLERLREYAPQWKDWLTDQAQEYQEVQGELSARQTLIQITRNTLQEVEQESEWLSSSASFFQETRVNAQEMLEELERIERSSNEITTDLVHLFSDAKELSQEVDYDEAVEALVEQERQRQVDAYLEEPWLYDE